jgi:HlyD family secretion protein
MKRLLKWIVICLLIATLCTLIYWELQKIKETHDPLTLYGNVDVRQADLGFRVNGRIIEVLAEEGDLVKPGDKLAALDPEPYKDEVNQARAKVTAAKVRLANADILLKRRDDLVTDGSISKEDLENAQSTRDVLAADLQEAIAGLGVAQTRLNDTAFYAPSEGTILTRVREPGTVVREGDAVMVLSVLDPVWIRAFIAEPALGMIYPGMKAEIHTDNLSGKIYEGHIGFISPVAEFTPKTVETTQLRTDLVFRLRVIADNPDKGLRQGMPVTVKLIP